MAICLSENFDTEKHSYIVTNLVQNLQGENVNDLIEEIYKVLEESPFSTSINDSSDTDNYKSSIDKLLKGLSETLKKEKNIAAKDALLIKRGLS